ncbi:MAG TPA: sigma-70 family RNA polymerase sigma factor [Vicinamibacterales bacterium]|jgi:RNA polymerase sigma factor (TIGR02999 family)
MTEPSRPHEDVTALLIEWRQGDAAALERLVPLVYAELKKVAGAHLRHERAGHSLQATALVHEVYLRLVNVDRLTFESRAHFMAVAARLMRQILVDHARRKLRGKRGGGATIVSLDRVSPADNTTGPTIIDVLVLDEALAELASFDAQQCRIVEMRFFAGLTIDEVAHALGISTATVEREWAVAKAWLYTQLSARTA